MGVLVATGADDVAVGGWPVAMGEGWERMTVGADVAGTGVGDGAAVGIGLGDGVAVGVAPQPAAPSIASAAAPRRKDRLLMNVMQRSPGKR